jgi:hypothetical protein
LTGAKADIELVFGPDGQRWIPLVTGSELTVDFGKARASALAFLFGTMAMT